LVANGCNTPKAPEAPYLGGGTFVDYDSTTLVLFSCFFPYGREDELLVNAVYNKLVIIVFVETEVRFFVADLTHALQLDSSVVPRCATSAATADQGGLMW